MIVRLNGGLGNQLFQYAFGESLSIKMQVPVSFHKFSLDNGNHRAYSLKCFNVNPAFDEPKPGMWFFQEKVFCYDPDVYKAPSGSTYYIGNWQTEKYFNESIIRQLFILRNPISPESKAVEEEMKRFVTVSVHVRRTDYLVPSTAAYHGNMGKEYYDSAMAYVRSQIPYARFYFFSDDIEWCKQTFTDDDCRFVGHNNFGNGGTGPGTEHEDMYLMSRCDHAIIPNSTFGWWGTWLNPIKTRLVVAPKQWFAPTTQLDCKDIVPARWTTI